MQVLPEDNGKAEGVTPLKRPVGRPKTITDMKAYKREKAREYRAKLKLERENAK